MHTEKGILECLFVHRTYVIIKKGKTDILKTSDIYSNAVCVYFFFFFYRCSRYICWSSSHCVLANVFINKWAKLRDGARKVLSRQILWRMTRISQRLMKTRVSVIKCVLINPNKYLCLPKRVHGSSLMAVSPLASAPAWSLHTLRVTVLRIKKSVTRRIYFGGKIGKFPPQFYRYRDYTFFFFRGLFRACQYLLVYNTHRSENAFAECESIRKFSRSK